MRNAGVVQSILEQFESSAVAQFEGIRQAIEQNDAESAGKQAHALKGAAATLAAESLRRAALALEESGRAGAINRLKEEFETLSEELMRCLQYIPTASQTAQDLGG